MKKFLLFLISFVLVGTMMARQLTPDEALALAMSRMNASQSMRARTLATGANAARVNLVHTEATDEDVPLYYVYNISDGGFIIASADDRASSLLGYTDNGTFEGSMQNLSFVAWLKDCSQALQWISQMPEVEGKTPSAQTRALATSVAPLLGDIQWNQNAPYNNTTPLKSAKDSEGNTVTKHAPTGCVATAVAQVMMYYKWPDTGTGSHTNAKDKTQTVDFSKSTYQWSAMLPKYKGKESQTAQDAVAKLMSDVGCALDMDYGYDESGTKDHCIITALVNHFKYDKSLRILYRYMYTSQAWNDLLMTELNEARPILFGGVAPSGGGHEFVLDGYDTNGLYHVNWGWGGMSNGYFDVNIMDSNNQGTGGYAGGYTIDQVIVLGVKPDKTGTSVGKPELVMTKHFTYDNENKSWKYSIKNYGAGDFKGEIALVKESPNGTKTTLYSNKYNTEPIVFNGGFDYSIGDPSVSGAGYKLYPCYSEVVGGELKPVSACQSSFCKLRSVYSSGKYVWQYDMSDIARIEINDVKVVHNYVGYAPKLTFKLTNPAGSLKEYADYLYIVVLKEVNGEDKMVCSGYASAFLNPGETKEVSARCSIVTEEFKDKITAGEYKYSINYRIGGYFYSLDSGTFDLVNIPASKIECVDYKLNKITFEQGEDLVGTVKLTNTGGYGETNLTIALFDIANDYINVGETKLKNAEMKANSTDIFTLKMSINLDPGNYIAAVFTNGSRFNNYFTITVVAPTALDEIQTTPDADAKKSTLYDLQGRPVQQLQKGSLYIGNGKFVVK